MDEIVQYVCVCVCVYFFLTGHEEVQGTWVVWETQAQVTKGGPTCAQKLKRVGWKLVGHDD